MPNWVRNEITMNGPQESIDAAIALLRNKDKTSGEAIDFNNIIKMPESLNVVAGGGDMDYVALYLATLSGSERNAVALKLYEVPTSFYGNYFKKYIRAFNTPVSDERRQQLEAHYKEEYKAINPASVEAVGKTYIENILKYGADTWYDWCCNNWGTKWGACESYIEGNRISFDTAWSAAIPVMKKLSEMVPDVSFRHEFADEDIGSNCGYFVYEAGQIVDEYLPERSNDAVRYACGVWGYDASEYLEEREEEEALVSPAPLEEQIAQSEAQVVGQDVNKGEIDKGAR